MDSNLNAPPAIPLTKCHIYAIMEGVTRMRGVLVNITVLMLERAEYDLAFIREKIAAHLKQDPQTLVTKIVTAERKLTKRGAQAKKELQEGTLLVVSVPTGEALRNLRTCGCQELVNIHRIFIVGGKGGKWTLKRASCTEETVLWPEAQQQRLVTRPKYERTERLPYKDD